LFADRVHLNGEGSLVFSPVFARIIKSAFDGEDVSGLFYKNIDELKNDIDRVVACNGRVNHAEDGTLQVEVKSLHNDAITPEYRLVLKKKAELQVAKAKAAADGTDDDGDEATNDAEDEDKTDDDEFEVEVTQLRAWQEETTFSVDPAEIPEGYLLCLEARKKGQTEATAHINGLTERYKGS